MSLTKRVRSFFWMTIIYTAMLAGVVAGGIYYVQRYMNREAELRAQVSQLKEDNARLQLANRLLKVDIRRARIDVLSQTESPDPQKIQTTFRFTEFDDSGRQVGQAREFTILGEKMYLDSLVVKFNDELVETNDEGRSHSLCVFQRVFGEFQRPSEGFPVDVADAPPAIYRDDAGTSELEKQIWSRFWEISNDPLLQKSLGVRANHGEAVVQKLTVGKSYLVELRASGGLSIRIAGEAK